MKLPVVRAIRFILRLAAPHALTTWACSSVEAPASGADAGATDGVAE
ncbi:MAG: hypothetical protein JNM74_09375, partial [Myxococcales bacterium]|nr:hypothetical protein [Myxococcales bacterium]